MMGMMMPGTCWAVFKQQVINLRSCCILLVDSVESMMMHGLANPKRHAYCFPRSPGDVANIVTNVQAGQSRNHGLTPGSGLFSKTSRLALAPIQPPIQWVLGIFYLGVNGQEHKGDNLWLASPKIQSQWSNNSNPPCASMVCTRTALSYLSFFYSIFKVLSITFCTLP